MNANTDSVGGAGRLKIVVLGGTGLIGKHVVGALRQQGHEVVAASTSTGVNAVTGQGLAAAFAGADVVVDVTNSPSFETRAVLEFFTATGRNLARAEQAAGVKHHVALSVVGTDRLPDSGYFRAKLAQEQLIAGSGIPYTIVRATQFFEFVGAIAESSVAGDAVRPATALFQPIAAAEVAAAVVAAALASPLNGICEVAGPDRVGIATAVRQLLSATGDGRPVLDDPAGLYFGAKVDDRSLTPGPGARLGTVRFAHWLRQTVAAGATH
jgi:uncharacterized protein YbjT (DUF2867 family)